MDTVEAEKIRAMIDKADVYVCRSKSGFWTYFSELSDRRWIVEYDPVFRYGSRSVTVLGPFGVRERLPITAPIADVGRVMLTVTQVPIAEPTWVRNAAALVSAHVVSLSDFEPLTELPWPLMEGVVYEVLEGGVSVQIYGEVELYGSGDLFRFETGDEVPLDEVRDRLWPADSSLRPDA